jgi:hypothetical protein
MAQVEAKIRSLRALDRALQNLVHACRTGQTTDRCPILKSLEEERSMSHDTRKTTR